MKNKTILLLLLLATTMCLRSTPLLGRSVRDTIPSTVTLDVVDVWKTIKIAQDGIGWQKVAQDQAKTLEESARYQAAADSSGKAKDSVIAIQQRKSAAQDTLISNQKKLTTIEVKKKRKWVKIALVAIVIGTAEFVIFVYKAVN